MMPFTKMGKAGEDFLSGSNSVHCFGHITFKVPIRYPRGDVIESVAESILSAEDKQDSDINVIKSHGTRDNQLRRERADEEEMRAAGQGMRFFLPLKVEEKRTNQQRG